MTINRRAFMGGLAAAPAAALASGVAGSSWAWAAENTAQAVPATHSFTLGDARITVLLDGHLPLGTELFNDFDPAKAETVLAKGLHRLKEGALQIPVNGYLVERSGQKLLIDTGTAQLMGPGLGALGAGLAAAGVAPESIDTVLLTHIHPDHSGGLITADGAAAFANAGLVVGQREWDFWHDDAILAGVREGSRGFFDMARRSVAPYADRLHLLQGESEAAPGFTAVELPGHTPGHTGFMLDAGGEGLLFWGDLIHSAALQFALPEWTIAFDTDPAQTAQTRRKMMDRAEADNLLVTGAHVDFPALGRVLRQGGAYAYQAAPWQFGI
ncbi:MBL fold metallo-hydrolase [Leisingera daeponensis]|uniref:MBL fold metallo-hydrolase n=1 Tax=Leisingera daeponensis TaxID=405746 RepID=A0ABS7NA61_9RHOB|nr:MBL fold metallo-hydrolase [Leisingera daeponensis]MBY6138094.1 MBL fold metallo-hydrolase [Leisingera daeponensis]